MIVNLTKNEIKHLVYLLGKGDDDYPELNSALLNKLQPLIDACTCKEQNEDWTCKLTHKAELLGHS